MLTNVQMLVDPQNSCTAAFSSKFEIQLLSHTYQILNMSLHYFVKYKRSKLA